MNDAPHSRVRVSVHEKEVATLDGGVATIKLGQKGTIIGHRDGVPVVRLDGVTGARLIPVDALFSAEPQPHIHE